MRKPTAVAIKKLDQFILHKPNSDIFSLKELKQKIFLKALEYYNNCPEVAAIHLQISASAAYKLKEECQKEASVEGNASDGLPTIGFFNLTSALTTKFNLLQLDGHFRSMTDLLGEIADRALVRYKTKSQAARKLGIEEDVLGNVIERVCIMPEDVPEEGISATFNEHGLNLFKDDGHIITLEDAEMALIKMALGHYSSVSEAARRLGMGRSTLYRKMEEYNIKQPEDVSQAQNHGGDARKVHAALALANG